MNVMSRQTHSVTVCENLGGFRVRREECILDKMPVHFRPLENVHLGAMLKSINVLACIWEM